MSDVPPPNRIERYEPEELLSSVGLVDTYRVRIQGEEGLAALKVLFLDRAEASLARSMAERFLAAGRRALACPAPGMARVFEISDDPETPFMVREFVPGIDLARLLQGGGRRCDDVGGMLAPVLVGQLCGQVAQVLAGAHAAKPQLFHLGLCPENVMVTPAGKAMVLDFGLAASLRGVGGGPIEKWRFVAPELIGVDAEGVSDEVARAADLYSLGALLYVLLGGKQLDEAATLSELSEQKWEPLPDIPDVPNHLLSAVRALTSPHPTERPDSAGLVVEWLCRANESASERELASALQRLGLRPTPSHQPTAPGAPPQPAVRRAILGKRAASRTRLAVPRPKVASAQAGRAGLRRWRRLALVAGGALLAGVISAWGVSTLRHTIDLHRPVDAGGPPVSVEPEMTRSIQAETMVLRPPDGGGRLGARRAVRMAEAYQPQFDSTPSRVPNHLFLDTRPSQANVWVDGVLRGKTPVDLATGPGSHRVVIIKPGYRMLRAVFDTTRGDFARRGLQPVAFPSFGDAVLDLRCEHADLYPVLVDDEETGLLCPVPRLLVPSGKHQVGIFVPAKGTVLAVEVTASTGRVPKTVVLDE